MRQVLVLSFLLILGACDDATESPGTDPTVSPGADTTVSPGADTTVSPGADTSDNTPYGCKESCAAVELAGCTGNDSDECLSSCEDWASGPCSGDVENFLACLKVLDANDAAWSCSEDGDTIAPEACAGDWNSSIECLELNKPSNCEEACPQMMAAGCVNSPPDNETCLSGCEEMATGPCNESTQSIFECLGLLGADDPDDTAWSCNDDGNQIPPEACTEDWEAAGQCLKLYEPSNCDEACDHIMAAECANGPPELSLCQEGCSAEMENECNELLNDFWACLGPLDAEDPNGAAWSCGDNGDALPPEACGERWPPVAQCLGI